MPPLAPHVDSWQGVFRAAFVCLATVAIEYHTPGVASQSLVILGIVGVPATATAIAYLVRKP